MREHVRAVNGMTGWHENFRPKHAKQVFLTEHSLEIHLLTIPLKLENTSFKSFLP